KLANELYRIIGLWEQSLEHPEVRPLEDGRLIPASSHPEDGCMRIADPLLIEDDDRPSRPPTKRVVRDENGVYWRGILHPLLGPIGRWIRIGKFGAASECRRLDPSIPIQLRKPKKGSQWLHSLRRAESDDYSHSRWTDTPLDSSKSIRAFCRNLNLSRAPL